MKKLQAKLQTFSGAMMVPIILLVLVGFFVGIGSAFTNYILTEGTILHGLFSLITSLGFMFMNNLPVWFAVAIAFTLAKKEKGWAAFAGIVLYLSYMTSIKNFAGLQGWTAETTSIEALLSQGYTELEAMNFNNLWGSSLGIFTYNMGIFSGIVTGLVTAKIHNRFVDTELPAMLGFFAGTKTVIIMVVFASIPLAVSTYYIWPFIAKGLAGITGFIGRSGLFGTFVFGTVDKMLLPFGLHHLIAFPIEYSAVGGVMEVDGVIYEGIKNIMNAQAASAGATGYLVRNFTSGRILFQLAGLPGAAYAMYKVAKPENKKKVAALLVPAVMTLALVGISEPIEYTFLFLAPQLYFFIYAPLCGLAYVIAEVFKISIAGNALLFMIPNLFQPHKVHAMSLIFLLPLTFVVYYFVFKVAIEKLDLNTPGRKSSDAELMSKKEYQKIQAAREVEGKELTLEEKIIEALGGYNNIISVTNCASRLRVEVKDADKVLDRAIWENELNASGLVQANNNFQIIYGVQVQSITTKVKDLLGID
ncbi:MAG TPA: PTS transporter subunit EIIC [Erysipelothrix sp.]